MVGLLDVDDGHHAHAEALIQRGRLLDVGVGQVGGEVGDDPCGELVANGVGVADD
jgi:hypothetical protein